jgi:malate synthase
MAPFIPSRKNPEINEAALAKVREDKLRETNDGFDGTWVAHPDLVPVALEVFERHLKGKPHQKERLRPEVNVTASQLLEVRVPGGTITEAGLGNNISVALQYLNAWLQGMGAVGIFNLMEDAATCEISRAQLWLWVQRNARLNDGRAVTKEFYEKARDAEVEKLGGYEEGRLRDAARLVDGLVLRKDFEEFLTLPAYQLID